LVGFILIESVIWLVWELSLDGIFGGSVVGLWESGRVGPSEFFGPTASDCCRESSKHGEL
jgi:hypothetical protein